MQAFNLSLTNVSVNSYREWQPPLSLTNVYVIMASSPESLWRLFAVWLDGQRSRARGPYKSKKCLRVIWTATSSYIGKISRRKVYSRL